MKHHVWPPHSAHPPVDDEYEGVTIAGIPGRILHHTVRVLIAIAIGCLFTLWLVAPWPL